MKCSITRVGFEYGPLRVDRMCDSDKHGFVCIALVTKKHSYKNSKDLEVTVSKSGKIRILQQDGTEWVPKK